ncbi:PAS domain-containing protein [Rhodopseudomonas palustris]|uniref:Diguanylate cyclase n=1 Tax=Rhodopseudomonas palustris TaxID=1076 RepID=A0A418VJ10_RHOPL|nr:PAS domain-containing protein [Rhodopseudomonas palustris]RJF76086.1 diguanylate cyclase [Rhodopseudomonas palustris]
MQRFVCEQNIAHFGRLLGEASDSTLRRTLLMLLSSAKRELALLNSQMSGANLSPVPPKRPNGDLASVIGQLRPNFETSPHPYMLIDPGPGLKIIDINNAYARATFANRNDIIGLPLFDVFPDNPAIDTADGVSNLYASLSSVVETGQPHAMQVQRYDVRDTTGNFVERYWQPINTPVHDADGRLICLLHHVEDVTAEVLAN